MKQFTVRFTDQRDPPKLQYEEIKVECRNSSEAIEAASTMFFTKHPGELHRDFLIGSSETIESGG